MTSNGLNQIRFTLLRRKPRVFRPWMNARRVPFEAPKERSRVCFGGFRPTKHVEEPRLRAVTHFGVQARALARGAPHRVRRLVGLVWGLLDRWSSGVLLGGVTELNPHGIEHGGKRIANLSLQAWQRCPTYYRQCVTWIR